MDHTSLKMNSSLEVIRPLSYSPSPGSLAVNTSRKISQVHVHMHALILFWNAVPPTELTVSPARLTYEQVGMKASGMGNEGTEEVEEERRRKKTNLRWRLLGVVSVILYNHLSYEAERSLIRGVSLLETELPFNLVTQSVLGKCECLWVTVGVLECVT